MLRSAFEIGLTPDLFWSLTWREYDLMVQAYEKKEESKWLHTREIIAMIYNTNITSKSQKRSGQQIIPLPSEKVTKKKVTSSPALLKEACKQLGIPFNPIVH